MLMIIKGFISRYKVYLYGAVLLSAMGGSAWVGYKVSEAKYVDELMAEIAWYESALLETQKASVLLREELTKQEQVSDTIPERIFTYVEERPSLDDCELDAIGLRIWNGEAE